MFVTWAFLLILLFSPSLITATSRREGITTCHGAVATDDGRRSLIGRNMLREGGHAIDATVVSALYLGVVSPASSGIGGGAFMVFKSANGNAQAFNMRESAPMLASQASSSSTPGFPSTVSFPLYKQMVLMVDRLEGENANLQHRVDQLYRENSNDEPDRPRLIARLEEIIYMAEDRLALMIPHRERERERERESQITLSAIADELRRVISHLRAPVPPPPSS
ncbi:hypothetical protein AgCh_038781 [Apium graveolens]